MITAEASSALKAMIFDGHGLWMRRANRKIPATTSETVASLAIWFLFNVRTMICDSGIKIGIRL